MSTGPEQRYGIPRGGHSIIDGNLVSINVAPGSAGRLHLDRYPFDAEYLRRLRDGDPVTIEHFITYFTERLTVKLWRRRYSESDREDIIQETFERTFEATPSGATTFASAREPDSPFHTVAVRNGDGTVTDNVTHLVWLKNADCFGMQSWSAAMTSASTLAGGACGLTDSSTAGQWRVPIVFDNLIAAKQMPVTIGVFINPGNDPKKNPPPKPGEKPAKPFRARYLHR